MNSIFFYGHNITITDRWRSLLMQEFNKNESVERRQWTAWTWTDD